MPQKILKFTGINRRVNEFQGAGACEELINLRPTETGTKIVKRKKTIISNANRYKFFIEHKFGSNSNFIAATDSSVFWVDNAGAVQQTIVESGSAENIACAGNVIVIQRHDGKQLSYKFINGKYENFSVVVPSINISVALSDFSATGSCERGNGNSIAEAQDTLTKAMSAFYQAYPHGLAGPIVIGCTFELEDGSEVWSSGFTIIDPSKDVRWNGVHNDPLYIRVSGANEAQLSFDITNYSANSGIKNIRFYSSLPVTPYEIDDVDKYYYATKIDNKDLNITGQTMYLQKVISYRPYGEFRLNTGYELAANALMPVTAGAIFRTGDVISYNNRFHYYNSDVEHILQSSSYGVSSNIQRPDVDDPNSSLGNYIEIRDARLYVVIDNGKERILVKDSKTIKIQYGTYENTPSDTIDLIYPLGGIKEGYLWTKKADGTVLWYKIDFHDSESYNYSYALDVRLLQSCEAPDTTGVIEAHGQSVYLKKETNTINASAQFNPYVFPVNNSYSFGGKILDVVTSYLPISSTQIGQYPLTVFTDNGIFALEQSNSNVLYGNVVPIQPMVIDGQAKATPHGIFFFSSKNLYVLVGRDVADMSNVLKGKRELGLRDLSIYKTIAHAFIGGENALSVMDFEEYAEGAVLAYDQLNNELYISNPSLPQNIFYSYVFSLDTKAFYKSNKCYIQEKNCYRYAIQQENDRCVVDMNTEEEVNQNVFLQSRPFSLEAFYTHIQRLIMQIDANLTGYQKLGLFVFASDNLHDWKPIITAQKKETVLRHIRTNKAPKSYKDYVIIISGTVSTDTDLSDLIADYTVVSRRLG